MSDYVGGLTYPLTVHAAFLDNSTYTTALTVTCMGGGKPWTPPQPQPGGGSYMYFAFRGSTVVVKVDTSNFQIVASKELPEFYTFTPAVWDDTWVYLAEWKEDDWYLNMTWLSKDTLEVGGSIKIEESWEVEPVAVVPVGDYVYVLSALGDLYKINKANFQVEAHVDIWAILEDDYNPERYGFDEFEHMAADEAGQHLYAVVSSGSSYDSQYVHGAVMKISIPDLTVEDVTWVLGGGSVSLYHVLVVGDKVYVGTISWCLWLWPAYVIKFAASTLEPEGSVVVASSMQAFPLCALNGKLYVGGLYDSDYNYTDRARIDLGGFTLETHVEATIGGNDLTAFTDGSFLYYSSMDDFFVAKVEPSTLEVVEVLPVTP